MPQLYANPLGLGQSGFYFDSLADYAKKMDSKRRNIRGGADFEHTMMFIDGDDDEQQLFAAMSGRDGLYPADLEDYYDVIELGDYDKAALYWLLERGYDLSEALEHVEDGDVSLHEGSAKDWAYYFIEEAGLPGNAANYYFDYVRFGRDLGIDRVLDPDPDNYDEGEDDPDYIEEEERISALSDEDYGVEYVENYLGGLDQLPKQTLSDYFDYDAWIRDLEINGEIDTFTFAGTDYVVDNAASI